jgi:hypothetical protein
MVQVVYCDMLTFGRMGMNNGKQSNLQLCVYFCILYVLQMDILRQLGEFIDKSTQQCILPLT